MGFGLPMAEWMQGPLSSLVDEGTQHVIDVRLVSEDFVQDLSAQFAAGAVHWTRLWSLAVLGHYLRKVNAAACPA